MDVRKLISLCEGSYPRAIKILECLSECGNDAARNYLLDIKELLVVVWQSEDMGDEERDVVLPDGPRYPNWTRARLNGELPPTERIRQAREKRGQAQ